ncbi:hypothetical protein [Nocardia arizonensis]|uniref:hypothetical protein n=1 Tax=Nocardia arizonensis TaxID=1141647 RepID=UPI0006D0BC46|nr:hypothetical protein [Nocardia arizonensis]
MTEIADWERRLQRELAEIRDIGARLAEDVAAVRGRGEVHGVLIDVDASGDITNLHIAPDAMRWSSNQLTNVLLDCHRKARAVAKTSVDRLIENSDPRIRGRIQPLQTKPSLNNRQRRSSEEEIEAADDAYFARRNRDGWMRG